MSVAAAAVACRLPHFQFASCQLQINSCCQKYNQQSGIQVPDSLLNLGFVVLYVENNIPEIGVLEIPRQNNETNDKHEKTRSLRVLGDILCTHWKAERLLAVIL